VQTFQHEEGVEGSVFSRDESRILTRSTDGVARLWIVGQNAQIFKHERSLSGAIGAVFNRDESRILTWSTNGTARLWAVGQNEAVQTFKHGEQVNGVVFSRDESRILTWCINGMARLAYIAPILAISAALAAGLRQASGSGAGLFSQGKCVCVLRCREKLLFSHGGRISSRMMTGSCVAARRYTS